MPRDYNFWIYIVTNKNHSVLYIGVTNRLSRRTWQHREGDRAGFASRYQCKKLVYYGHYRDVRDAIARESQLKRWSGKRKIDLIDRLNPRWEDLGAEVLQDRGLQRCLEFARHDKRVAKLWLQRFGLTIGTIAYGSLGPAALKAVDHCRTPKRIVLKPSPKSKELASCLASSCFN